jgi:hypothetical protein
MRDRRAAMIWVAGMLSVALGAWAVTLALCWPTYFEMNPATGAVAALADAALGHRVPGGNEGDAFLATFYFPPEPLLTAAGRRLGLDWKDALRVGSVVGGLLLLGAVGWATRAAGARRGGAWLAIALLASTYFFKSSSLGGRADLLAAAFSIAALASWLGDRDLRGWRVPVLAACSFLVKATSVAVPVALVLFLLARREPSALLRFAWRFAVAALAIVALLWPFGGPTWYASAIRELATATPCIWSASRGPAEVLRYLGAHAELAALAALALAAVVTRTGRASPLAAYGVAVLALALFVMANHGAGHNHLDDATAFAAVCAAQWSSRRVGRGALWPAFLLSIVVVSATWRDLVPVLRHTPNPENRRTVVVAAVRDERGAVFTEDALLALAAGREPVISDPGALRSLVLKGDPRAERVVTALRERRYELVVLMMDLDAGAYWYRNFHLGDPVVAAIRARYRHAGTVDGYALYRPIEAPEPAVP